MQSPNFTSPVTILQNQAGGTLVLSADQRKTPLRMTLLSQCLQGGTIFLIHKLVY